MKNPLKIILVIIAAILVLSFLGSCGNNKTAPVKPVEKTAVATPEKPVFNDAQYRADVQTLVDAFNNNPAITDGTGTIALYIQKDGTPPTVEIGLNDLTFWTISADTQKKEYMTIIGKKIGEIATANGSTTQPYVDFYTQNGVKLGSFTVWGSAKIDQ